MTIPFGYQQVTGLSAVKALTVPTGATRCVIQADTQAVRYRDDGTNPSASVGQPLAVGVQLMYDARMDTIRFIEQAASAVLNVTYYSN
jgi:hypothetical protein